MSSYAQLNQDLHVVQFYNHKRSGFFVDIGAHDGVELSNTYLLEKDYGWTGICAEPVPKSFASLCINRPNSVCCDKAVYTKSNETVVFDIIANDRMYSGISSEIVKWVKPDSEKTKLSVQTISLNDLLDQFHAPPEIDYLSIDTEGSEYSILKSFDFTKHTFGLIDVEHNYVEPTRSQIRELLTNNGYIFLRENKWDDQYKHHSKLQA